MTFDFARLAKLQAKILFFRASRQELLSLGRWEFLFGLIGVWLAGIGRAWDNNQAIWIYKSGLLSVVYIFVLTTFLYIFILGLRPKNWHWTKLLCFISMTGIIGTIYAIPLEMMLPPDDAALGNTCFLFLVASWRVALLGYYLFKVTELRWFNSLVALVLPLTLIVNLLIAAEQFEKTFAIMGGFRYYVLVDKAAAEANFAKAKADAIERNKKSSYPIVYGDLITSDRLEPVPGGKKGVVRTFDYTDGGERTLPGYREIKWDDPEYLPPGPMMAVIRPLGNFSLIAAPVLLIYYVSAVIFFCFRAIMRRAGDSQKPPSANSVDE